MKDPSPVKGFASYNVIMPSLHAGLRNMQVIEGRVEKDFYFCPQ